MSQIRYSFSSLATIFVLFGAGVLHGLRLYYGWDLVIDGWMVPIWVSGLAVVVTFSLALSQIYHHRH